jgi:hypothetical protein
MQNYQEREEYGKDHGFACKNESYNAVGGQRHVVSKKVKLLLSPVVH